MKRPGMFYSHVAQSISSTHGLGVSWVRCVCVEREAFWNSGELTLILALIMHINWVTMAKPTPSLGLLFVFYL